jgi:hypothetical protein
MMLIDPLKDMRWTRFIETHPRASLFHSVPWLQALRQTYGYEPLVYTSCPPDQDLTNGIAFCRVESWLTGRRLVSLPFSDHCEPLFDDHQDAHAFICSLEGYARQQKFSYVELRPVEQEDEALRQLQVSSTYCLHHLDLTAGVEVLFRNLHKESTQRKIHRAKRERLAYQEGRSEALLNDFYLLLQLSRRRHGIPPQPRAWFGNLIQGFGEALKIRVVYRDKQPVAAIVTIGFKNTLVYKFGGSDARFHNLGGMQLLLWKSIVEAKEEGRQRFDLGRSDSDNRGLITFKDRLGATRLRMNYWRYYPKGQFFAGRGGLAGPAWQWRLMRRIFSHIPNACLSAVGSLLYRHIG